MESRWLLYYTTTRSQGNQFQVYRECFLAKKFLLGVKGPQTGPEIWMLLVSLVAQRSQRKRKSIRGFITTPVSTLAFNGKDEYIYIYISKMKCADSASNMRLFPSWIQVLIEHVNASGLGLTIGAVARKQRSDIQSWHHCHHMSPPPRIPLKGLWFLGSLASHLRIYQGHADIISQLYSERDLPQSSYVSYL